jgi:hypothetical protein
MIQNSHVLALLRLPTFASLLNQKIIILSDSSDYVAVDHYFFNDCLRPLIDKVHLDEQWYMQKYPDVRQAIIKKIVKDSKDHFMRFGYFEHRLPYQIKVQEEWYLDQYPDIRKAIEQEKFISGQEHFETVGFREGRIPHPNFELATMGQKT